MAYKHRVWLDSLSEGRLSLSGDVAHYLKNVLRLSEGEELTLLSGDGHVGHGRIISLGAEGVDVSVEQVIRAPGLDTHLTVAVAAPKGDRADWLVEKLTEIGVARIVWLRAARSVVIPKEGGARRERWERLAQAAARQAQRPGVPSIEGPIDFSEALDLEADLRLIADRSGGDPTDVLATAPGRVVLMIGPEGGFSPAELLRAVENGYTALRLAPYTLRVETAALAGAALLLSRAGPGPAHPS